MVDKKVSAVTARRQARERLAQERAEQAERNRRNEEDLVEFLVSQQQITAADSDRDTAIKSARERHRIAVEKLQQRQAVCLARMSERGESSAAIADRTGLSVREIKQRFGRRVHEDQPDEESLATAAERPARQSRTDASAKREPAEANNGKSVRKAAATNDTNQQPVTGQAREQMPDQPEAS